MITEFKDYNELPFSRNIQQELFKRHEHGTLESGPSADREQILYKEKDVLILLQLQQQENIYLEIRKWAKERGILDKGNILIQTAKLQEEVGELAKAVLYKKPDEISDAIGDIVIVLTSLSYFNGSDIGEDVRKALAIVQQRTGKMRDGNFFKD